ncbi:MAG: hypothetical protein JRJ06_04945 [Deltaproteobacteria bacterium]|nr:hypothetical protein [Deltaproteobacteria bacterium]
MEIITTHKNADFDALASVFASSILYPGAEAVLPRTINPNVRAFLSLHKEQLPYITRKEIEPGDVTRLIVVDTNSWTRLDGMDSLMAREELDVHLWDHHEIVGDIEADWSCQEVMGSTTTLLQPFSLPGSMKIPAT